MDALGKNPISVAMNRGSVVSRRVAGSVALLVLVFCAAAVVTEATEESGGGYRQRQIPGLNESASKIFFTEKPWSVSGWGELNGVFPVHGERDRSSGDLELYYETLTRLTAYLGLRPADNISLTLEAQVEYLTDAEGGSKTEVNPEFYFGFIGNEHFNSRFGLAAMHIGYINNNDEPLLFYSVNRPESERLIIPTEWVEFGLHFYGGLTKDVHYALAFTNGVEAKDFRDATWIRGGKEGRVDLHGNEQICVNPQIEYTGFSDLTLSFSGYYGRSGQGEKITVDDEMMEVEAPITMVSGYGRWDRGRLRLIVMGAYGLFGQTVKSLSFFGRVERLDTHAEVIAELGDKSYVRNDLTLLLVGLNYKHWQHLVLKLDYQFRHNRAAGEGTDSDSGLIELGLGFAL